MLNTKPNKRTISDEVDRIVNELATMQADTQEYEAKVKQLRVLCEARSMRADRLINTETLVTAGVNILGILLILNYENLHVVSSKALGFVLKGRMN